MWSFISTHYATQNLSPTIPLAPKTAFVQIPTVANLKMVKMPYENGQNAPPLPFANPPFLQLEIFPIQWSINPLLYAVKNTNPTPPRNRAYPVSTKPATLTTNNYSPLLSPIDQKFLHQLDQDILSQVSNSNISIEELATKHTMSRTTFYRKIKELTNLSPVQYIRTRRIEIAHHLLQTQPHLMVNEVMSQVGISDRKHFNFWFKERYVISPSEVRKEKG